MSETTWIGTTQAGRELRLSGGAEQVTATLDGEPIEIFNGHHEWAREMGGSGYAIRSSAGTFTAIEEGTGPEFHSRLLRDLVEARPSNGWTITTVRAWETDDGEHRFAFEVTNGWRTATIERYFAPAVVRTWTGADDGRTMEEMAMTELRRDLRSANWPAIQQLADQGPTTALRSDFPPSRY